MKFIPFQKYTLYTRLSTADVKQRLQQSLAFRSKWFGVTYDGEIERDAFTIFQVSSLGFPGWPDISGRFSAADRKTSIDISIKLPKLAFILGGTALAFLLVCFAGILWSNWSRTHSLRSTAIGALFIAVALALVYSAITVNFLIASARSKKFLRRLLEAE
ncbi:MAG TPA: hypothetical protein VMH27_13265 [Puia sp.]|nr:hypothetical protein [Puia sp.]